MPDDILGWIAFSFFMANAGSFALVAAGDKHLEWTSLKRDVPRGFIIGCVLVGFALVGSAVAVFMLFQKKPSNSQERADNLPPVIDARAFDDRPQTPNGVAGP